MLTADMRVCQLQAHFIAEAASEHSLSGPSPKVYNRIFVSMCFNNVLMVHKLKIQILSY